MAALAMFAVAVVLAYRPDLQPLSDEFTPYVAQGILRGEKIYATTTFPYPPIAPLVSALFMYVSSWLGPTPYLAPRVGGVLAIAASCMLMYAVTRQAFRASLPALLAGLVLLTYTVPIEWAAAGLHAKLLVLFLTLAALLAVQRGRWMVSGCLAALAAGCWPQAALVPAALGLVALMSARRQGRMPVARFVAGCLLGLLPSAVYLLATEQIGTFIQQLRIRSLPRPELFTRNALNWVISGATAVLNGSIPPVFPLLALIGFFWALARGRDQPPAIRSLLESGSTAFPAVVLSVFTLLYLTLSGLSALEPQGTHDLVPFYYLVAFWSAVGAVLFAAHVRRAYRAPLLIGACLYTVTAVTVRAAFYHVDEPITAGEALVHELSLEDPAVRFASFGAVSLYVMSDRQTATRYWDLKPYRMAIMEAETGEQCPQLAERIARQELHFVIIDPKPSSCERAFIVALRATHVIRAYDRYYIFERRAGLGAPTEVTP